MSRAPTVGICEDDDELRAFLRAWLEEAGWLTRATTSGLEAMRVFGDAPPAVLVIGARLPDAAGRDIVAALRARGSGSRLLLLAEPGTPEPKVGGADRHVPKPPKAAAVVAAVRELLRVDADTGTPPPLDAAGEGLELDPLDPALVVDGDRVELTRTELRLVAALTATAGDVVSRATLASAGWPDGAVVYDGILDAHLTRVRRKLAAADADLALLDEGHAGYRLV